jgi:hypothetical protein
LITLDVAYTSILLSNENREFRKIFGQGEEVTGR